MRHPVSVSNALPRLDHHVYGPSTSPWKRAPDVDPSEARALGPVHPDDRLARGTDEPVEVRPLAREEPGLLDVAPPVADVELAVPDVEVARQHAEGSVLAQLCHPRRHGVEEEPLRVLLGGVGLARGHVGADHGEALALDLEVRLDPASCGVAGVDAELPCGTRASRCGWRSRHRRAPWRAPRRRPPSTRAARRRGRPRSRGPPAASGCRHPPSRARGACPCARRRGCR